MDNIETSTVKWKHLDNEYRTNMKVFVNNVERFKQLINVEEYKNHSEDEAMKKITKMFSLAATMLKSNLDKNYNKHKDKRGTIKHGSEYDLALVIYAEYAKINADMLLTFGKLMVSLGTRLEVLKRG